MRYILAGALALLALTACGDGDPTGAGAGAKGMVSFTLPGPDRQPAGPFNANGALSPDSVYDFRLGNWAFAELGTNRTPDIQVYASAPAGNGRFHLLEIELRGDVPAGSVIEARFSCGLALPCASMNLYTSLVSTAFDEGGGPEVACVAEGGSVRITERANGRIKGTFNLVNICGLFRETTNWPYTIGDGSFDLPLLVATRRPVGG